MGEKLVFELLYMLEPICYYSPGNSKLLLKGPDSKYFRLCPVVFVPITQLCCCSMKAAIGNR